MVSYYLDEAPQKNAIRTVRSASCPKLPEFYDRIYLGEYGRIEPALAKARIYHPAIGECVCCRARDPVVLTDIPIRKAS